MIARLLAALLIVLGLVPAPALVVCWIFSLSLTIAGLRDDAFEVALIPHTLEVTTLGALEPGDEVNLEVDVLAKYVEKLIDRDTISG